MGNLTRRGAWRGLRLSVVSTRRVRMVVSTHASGPISLHFHQVVVYLDRLFLLSGGDAWFAGLERGTQELHKLSTRWDEPCFSDAGTGRPPETGLRVPMPTPFSFRTRVPRGSIRQSPCFWAIRLLLTFRVSCHFFTRAFCPGRAVFALRARSKA